MRRRCLRSGHCRCGRLPDLPEFVEIQQQGLILRGYPAPVADQGRIDLRPLDARDKARAAHRADVLDLRSTGRLRDSYTGNRIQSQECVG